MLDIIQRYAPVVNKISKSNLVKKRIVEVGGTGEGIGWYLPNYEIIDCDIKFVKRPLLNTKTIKISNEKIPLPNNFSDFVVSVDTLEHLSSREKQAKMIKEMLRVAKKQVILAVPTGIKSIEFHQKLFKFMRKRFPQKEFDYLEEHIKLGHPEQSDLLKMIKESGYKTKITLENNANLYCWLGFQKLYLYLPQLYHFFRYRRFIYMILRPLFSLFNFQPTLRTVFYIEKMII